MGSLVPPRPVPTPPASPTTCRPALWWWARRRSSSARSSCSRRRCSCGAVWNQRARTSRLGRRAYDPRGSRPRTWARPRDLRELSKHGDRRSGRFSVGQVDGRRLYAQPESHIAVVAPTRVGQDDALRHPVAARTRRPGDRDQHQDRRARRDAATGGRVSGRVQVFDPFGAGLRRDGRRSPAARTGATRSARPNGSPTRSPKANRRSPRTGAARPPSSWRRCCTRPRATSRGIDDVLRWVDAQDGRRAARSPSRDADAERPNISCAPC